MFKKFLSAAALIAPVLTSEASAAELVNPRPATPGEVTEFCQAPPDADGFTVNFGVVGIDTSAGQFHVIGCHSKTVSDYDCKGLSDVFGLGTMPLTPPERREQVQTRLEEQLGGPLATYCSKVIG